MLCDTVLMDCSLNSGCVRVDWMCKMFGCNWNSCSKQKMVGQRISVWCWSITDDWTCTSAYIIDIWYILFSRALPFLSLPPAMSGHLHMRNTKTWDINTTTYYWLLYTRFLFLLSCFILSTIPATWFLLNVVFSPVSNPSGGRQDRHGIKLLSTTTKARN